MHGAADRGAAFARVGRYLPGVDLVRFDRRGYGRSAGPGSGAEGTAVLAGQVDDVVALVDWARSSHGARVPAVVLGHSHGALVGLGAALASASVSGVVAWEPPMPWAPWWSSGGRATAGSAARRAGGGAGADAAGDAMEAFLRRMLGDDRWESLPDTVRAARRREGPALLADLDAARAAGALDLNDVGVPVVLGVGGATSARHRRAVQVLAATLAGATVTEVPDADHGAHLTHPEVVAAAVHQCLALVSVDGGGDTGTLRP